jgi:RES domain-containing protein
VIVWRIVRPVYAANPLSGLGAAQSGSRWNSRGVRMAYTSTSRALAVLEALVHVTREYFPHDAVLLPIEIPDNLIEVMPELPEGWDEIPYSPSARLAGDRWIKSGASLALRVPSAVLPAESNVLINPAHPQFGLIRLGEPESRVFDGRLLGAALPQLSHPK